MIKNLFYVAAGVASVAVTIHAVLEICFYNGYDKGWNNGYDYGYDRCEDGQNRDRPA